ncbi:hypothetical protein LCGC14_1855300, partial [marine sediment metagenome]
ERIKTRLSTILQLKEELNNVNEIFQKILVKG